MWPNMIVIVMAVVYKHIRLDTNEVFYVGIGKTKRRAFSKLHRNRHWRAVVAKTEYSVFVVSENISWEEACEQEKLLIREYGRCDLRLGSLTNMTDGGEGAFNPGDEVRHKIRAARIGRGYNKGVKRLDLSNRNRSRKGQASWNKGIKNPTKSENQRGIKNHMHGRIGSENPRSKGCVVDGVVYDAATTASKTLNINYYTLTKRLTSLSKKYSSWYYL